MTTDTKKIIYSMDRVGRIYQPNNKKVLRDISLGFYYGAKIVLFWIMDFETYCRYLVPGIRHDSSMKSVLLTGFDSLGADALRYTGCRVAED
jgi:hypothetical protein